MQKWRTLHSFSCEAGCQEAYHHPQHCPHTGNARVGTDFTSTLSCSPHMHRLLSTSTWPPRTKHTRPTSTHLHLSKGASLPQLRHLHERSPPSHEISPVTSLTVHVHLGQALQLLRPPLQMLHSSALSLPPQIVSSTSQPPS